MADQMENPARYQARKEVYGDHPEDKWYWRRNQGFNRTFMGRTAAETHRDLIDRQTRKDGTYTSDYGGALWIVNAYERIVQTQMNMTFEDSHHPRMWQNFDQGAANIGSVEAPCHLSHNRFLMCAMNLSSYAAMNQCRMEFRAYRECQSDHKFGAKTFKLHLEQQLKDASRAIGDKYFDLTADQGFQWGTSSFAVHPGVGENGNCTQGIQNSERYKWDIIYGRT